MRTLPRVMLLFVVLSVVGGAVMVGQAAKTTGTRMADAAGKLLETFSADEKKAALFPFDDENRTAWFFTPQQDKDRNPTRKGLRFDKMSMKQKQGVLDLLKIALSAKGYEQATGIMSLENVLLELEGKSAAMVRNPNWYFFSVYGEPSNTGTWSWRVEGHHLSVNFTIEKGEVVSATPLVFATNPAEIRSGDKKGHRTLPEIEDLAREFIKTLTPEQNKAARLDKQLPEIKERQTDAGVGSPLGIPGTKLEDSQVKQLFKLAEAYANRLPTDLAEAEMKRVTDAGLGKISFAYCIEDDKPGKPWTYRIHGPTFVVEFLNVQADAAKNPANHIHSGWRTLPQDFDLKK